MKKNIVPLVMILMVTVICVGILGLLNYKLTLDLDRLTAEKNDLANRVIILEAGTIEILSKLEAIEGEEDFSAYTEEVIIKETQETVEKN